jgi:hypothetical protein
VKEIIVVIAKKKTVELDVPVIERGRLTVCVIGRQPLIINRMSQKAWHELLLPQKKTAATRAANLKHNPLQEFRDSAYTLPDGSPTLLGMPATAFKAAMRSAALRIEGATKQEVGEMLYVEGDAHGFVPIWGQPQVFSTITRNSDPGHTPDVRTRCLVWPWATRLQIIFTRPYLNEKSVLNLLAMAGMTQGVGDGRANKGWANYGEFAPGGDDVVEELIAQWARTQQVDTMANPIAFDSETSGLLEWFDTELDRRGVKLPATA